MWLYMHVFTLCEIQKKKNLNFNKITIFANWYLFTVNVDPCFHRKLNDVLTTRIIKFFMDQSKKDPQTYLQFYEDYGLFFREGIVTTHDQDLRVSSIKSGKKFKSILIMGINMYISKIYVDHALKSLQ